MNLDIKKIKHTFKKHYFLFSSCLIFTIIMLPLIIEYSFDQWTCNNTKDLEKILFCLERIEDDNLKIIYLENKKPDIQIQSNNLDSYSTVLHIYDMYTSNNILNYKFLLEKSENCLSNKTCLNLYEKYYYLYNNQKLEKEKKLKLYENYMDTLDLKNNEKCIKDEIYIRYIKIQNDINNMYYKKFSSCLDGIK